MPHCSTSLCYCCCCCTRLHPKKWCQRSLQVSALRRRQGGEGTAGEAENEGCEAKPTVEPSGGLGRAIASWDTPAARELRTKIKSLEREARKREAMLQVGESIDTIVQFELCLAFNFFLVVCSVLFCSVGMSSTGTDLVRIKRFLSIAPMIYFPKGHPRSRYR